MYSLQIRSPCCSALGALLCPETSDALASHASCGATVASAARAPGRSAGHASARAQSPGESALGCPHAPVATRAHRLAADRERPHLATGCWLAGSDQRVGCAVRPPGLHSRHCAVDRHAPVLGLLRSAALQSCSQTGGPCWLVCR